MHAAGSGTSSFSALVSPTVALLIALILAWAGVLAPLDQALQEMRFEASDRPASGETLFVEIDSKSLQDVGVWPWPRQVHANVLDRLMQLGVAEVVLDIDFSTASTPEGDLALEQALERAGGYVFLAAFQQSMADGTVVLNVPLERFATHSEPVLVNVDGDGTGLLRSVPAGLPAAGIRSVAAALVPQSPISRAAIAIDYGIDLRSIQRVSVSDLLYGDFNHTLFANKQVIVGASAIELRDFFRVPRFGVIPGPLVQLAATETLKAGRPISDLGLAPALAIALVAIALFASRKGRMSTAPLAWVVLGSMLLMEVAAWLVLRERHLTLDTAAFHVFAVLLVLISLLHERAMHWRQIFRQQARLAYLASHDAVTGAHSRQALLDELEGYLSSGGASVFLVQLGRLDSTIAALGHEVGDCVAVEVAQRLEKRLGSKPARIANDVFAWSLPKELRAEHQIALRRSVSACLDEPYAVNGHSVVLDTRFASSTMDAAGVGSELLRQAEVALSEARRENLKVVAYTSEQSDRINDRRMRDIALREALGREEFFLLYQPQIDLRSGDLMGVEALVRWQSGSLGLVSPADFIPLAEETGLIVNLGKWILVEACTRAARWNWDGRLSVNVSSIQFRRSDMVTTVRQALEQSGLPANRLDLELTESLLVDDDPAILSTLEELRQMGVSLALDDFGTGYSSLSYLSRLPIDKIKIDQSFVRPLPEPNNEAIVETIVLMARRLSMSIVAEGIETAEQRDYLAALGCQVGQGYLFGRPSTPKSLGLEAAETAAA
ncbi:putative bifunctional diguanylate cyclase/phosphodiesterase [Devosia naphthalenivorans]|uniref:putative bifunctional diguanylate cyclase/phosphodiesterase n=1 Tax=Devosia naphthalenivorans TaxID=2082392 RepID=UPI000D3D5F13|nr:EAL domain-containing protein [Devosia naphthalenivorans]